MLGTVAQVNEIPAAGLPEIGGGLGPDGPAVNGESGHVLFLAHEPVPGEKQHGGLGEVGRPALGNGGVGGVHQNAGGIERAYFGQAFLLQLQTALGGRRQHQVTIGKQNV